jgi:hypothetical protein
MPLSALYPRFPPRCIRRCTLGTQPSRHGCPKKWTGANKCRTWAPHARPPIPDADERIRQIELLILYSLTNPDDDPCLWSRAEIEREYSDSPYLEDAISRLYRAGLIHRTSDGFIFASRTAVYQVERVGYGVS